MQLMGLKMTGRRLLTWVFTDRHVVARFGLVARTSESHVLSAAPLKDQSFVSPLIGNGATGRPNAPFFWLRELLTLFKDTRFSPSSHQFILLQEEII